MEGNVTGGAEVVAVGNWLMAVPYVAIGWFGCFLFVLILIDTEVFDKITMSGLFSFIGGIVTYLFMLQEPFTHTGAFQVILLWVLFGILFRLGLSLLRDVL